MCSHSIQSTSNSYSSSRCWFPAMLRYQKSDYFKTNFMSQLSASTYRLPILSSRSLSSLRLKRSWFLFSCFSATVFWKKSPHFIHTVTGQRDLQGDYSDSKTKVVRQRTVSLHFYVLAKISTEVLIFLTTSLTYISARNATPYSALSACALRQAHKLWGKDCLTMSVHNTQWNSALALR